MATDVDTASLTYAVGTTAVPTKGSVLVNGDGTYSYTPALNANGTDTFSYTVTDGTTTVEKTITVTITPVNDAPVAADGTATTNEDTVLNGTLPVATDVDTASLTYAVGTTAVPTKGSVLVNGDGTYSYTPGVERQRHRHVQLHGNGRHHDGRKDHHGDDHAGERCACCG
ncbi:MAG: tandem-95 repeat protein [Hyphomicrobium sp.]|nr:tandem-95 repeat protein [Hyphomicrobium sp.]